MWRKLSVDDIFISYSRADAPTYADGLASALVLRGFTVFIDRLGTPASSLLPSSLLNRLRGASMLVVIGSPAAAASRFVAQEVAVFADAGRSDRIVPIGFGDTVCGAVWYPKVRGIPIELERETALSTGDVSLNVVSRVEKAFRYTRSKDRLRQYTRAAQSLLALMVLLSMAALMYARTQIDEAANAETRAAAADARTRTAEARRVDAEHARESAVTLAEHARTEAERQQDVATALQLANESEVNRGTRREDLVNSLRLAVQSVKRHPTNAGFAALRSGLALTGELVEAHSVGVASGAVWTSVGSRALAVRTTGDELHVWKDAKLGADMPAPSLTVPLPSGHSLVALSDDARYIASAKMKLIRLHDTAKATTCEYTLPEEDDQFFQDIAISGTGGYIAALVVQEEIFSLYMWKINEGETGACGWKKGILQLGDVQFVRPLRVRFGSLNAQGNAVLTVHGYQDYRGTYYAYMRSFEALRNDGQEKPANAYRLVENAVYRTNLGVTVAEAPAGGLIALANEGAKTCWILERNLFGGYDEVARVPMQGKVMGAAFDYRTNLNLYVQTSDGAVQRNVWHAAPVAERTRLSFEEPLAAIGSLPDGRFFTIHQDVEGGKTKRFWNRADGVEDRRRPMSAVGERTVKVVHPGPRHTVRASSVDGRFLAVGTRDGSVRVVEAKTGEVIALLQHQDLLGGMVFSHDHRYLAVATAPLSPDTRSGEASSVYVWPLDPNDLLRRVCLHAPEACTR